MWDNRIYHFFVPIKMITLKKIKVNLYYVFTSNTITQEALLAENKLRRCFSVADITLIILLQIL